MYNKIHVDIFFGVHLFYVSDGCIDMYVHTKPIDIHIYRGTH